jgi:pimeloyl-ACP methyl ester carboxylesterase
MGTATFAQWDEPDGLTARGTLVLLPGRGEQPTVYERLGRRLAADAYRVRAVTDATARLSEVSAQVEDLLAEQANPAPRVLIGSDTGALVALRLVAQRTVRADAVILAGLPDTRYAVATPASWDDEVRARTSCGTHQAWISDPSRLSPGSLSVGRIPVQLTEELDLSAITVPVLGLHGIDDVISPLARIRAEFARLPTARLISVTGSGHDVLNDVTHRSVAATIVLFLESLREDAEARGITRLEDLSIERGIHRARTSQAVQSTRTQHEAVGPRA